jgi:cell fate regulator YaaT (PSP1 superfamily)
VSDDSSQGAGSRPPKKRRRRRRRPADERGRAPSAGAKSGGKERGKPPGAGKGGSDGKSGRSPQRKRRRRRGDGPAGGGRGRQGRGEGSQQRGRRPRRNSEDLSPSASAETAFDTAWQPPVATVEDDSARSEVLRREAEARVDDTRWGDDSDAPTPDVSLSADLPVNPPHDDEDPTSAYLDEAHSDAKPGDQVANVVGVRFAPGGKIYLYDSADAHYDKGQEVLVDSGRNRRLGRVAVASRRQKPPRSLKPVLRLASGEDRQISLGEEDKARELLSLAKREAKKLRLRIKLFRAHSEGDSGRYSVYYSSEDKTDVRPLSRALSKVSPLRIELRQTGVRDEAKMVGGIGSCGQELCCSTWLPAFVPVSIKNAKDQGLVLNPTKVSGQCGRLKCCLVYEQETYATMRKGLPKLGKRVITNDGHEGRVVEVDVLKQRIRVNVGRGEFKIYGKGEVEPMFASQPQGSGKQGKKKKKKSKGGDDRSSASRGTSSKKSHKSPKDGSHDEKD